jgi:hypothetical protein
MSTDLKRKHTKMKGGVYNREHIQKMSPTFKNVKGQEEQEKVEISKLGDGKDKQTKKIFLTVCRRTWERRGTYPFPVCYSLRVNATQTEEENLHSTYRFEKFPTNDGQKANDLASTLLSSHHYGLVDLG